MSIADRTASSASSEYGGCLSRPVSRLTVSGIEDSTCELDIFPGGALPGGVPQERSGMVGDDQWNAVIAMQLPAELADRELCVEQSLGSERSQSKDYSRL